MQRCDFSALVHTAMRAPANATSMWVRLCLHVACSPTHVRGDSVFANLMKDVHPQLLSMMVQQLIISHVKRSPGRYISLQVFGGQTAARKCEERSAARRIRHRRGSAGSCRLALWLRACVATMLGQIFARIGARLSAVSRGKVRVLVCRVAVSPKLLEAICQL
jgi:hypothetical protein